MTKGMIAVGASRDFLVSNSAWHLGYNGAMDLSGAGWTIRDSVFFEAQGSALVLSGTRASSG